MKVPIQVGRPTWLGKRLQPQCWGSAIAWCWFHGGYTELKFFCKGCNRQPCKSFACCVLQSLSTFECKPILGLDTINPIDFYWLIVRNSDFFTFSTFAHWGGIPGKVLDQNMGMPGLILKTKRLFWACWSGVWEKRALTAFFKDICKRFNNIQ